MSSKDADRNNSEIRNIEQFEELLEDGYVEDPNLTQCGFASCSPTWLQTFASKKSYVLVHSVLGILDSSLGGYLNGTISSIEKRFKLPSSASGIISSFWDIGSIGTAIFLSYFASKGHKTRWIGFGTVLIAVSCFLRYLPHYMFGPGDRSFNQLDNSLDENLCKQNITIEENCSLNSEGSVAFYIFLLSQLLLGIGSSPYYTLAPAYLDDNIRRNKFPVILGVVEALYFIGPALGLMLASYNLSNYINPTVTPSFTVEDPRWIGAWYLAWVPYGCVTLLLAFFIALFPKMLPREAARRRATNTLNVKETRLSSKDFKQVLVRLIKNQVLVYNTLSVMFYIIGIIGYWTFLPKYIETQFRKTASEANLVIGAISLFCTSSGLGFSGIIMSKFKPNSQFLAAWSVITESLEALMFIFFTNLTCYNDDLQGSLNLDGSWDVLAECNAACNCSSLLTYSPVCSSDRSRTFFSPCHAGCTTSLLQNDTKTFYGCNCIDGLQMATDGTCPSECGNEYLIFILVLCIVEFVASTGRHGNTILQYRAVHPDDKDISIALYEGVMCEIAFIPAAIVFGIILDYSCLIWEETCGESGNCWIYDGQKMRYLQNLTAAGLVFVAVLFDIGVFVKVGNMKIYEEDINKSKDENNIKRNNQ